MNVHGIVSKTIMSVAAAAMLLWAIPALAGDQDFTLHNKTGRTMKALFVSPADKDSWGSDILGEDTLADGADVTVKFPRDEEECKWDVRGEFEDGTYAEVRDVDFCTVTDVTFHP